MAKKIYKLNNENKLNNKSELQSKSDSVVLTNYKNLEDNFFIEEKNQEIKNKDYFGSIAYTLSKKNEMIKKLEDLKQFSEQLENGQKYLSENYDKLMPLQEVEKRKFEELIKEFKQFHKQLENGQKYLLEIYTELTIISEAEKRELEKINNLENSSNSSGLGYENLDLIGLQKDWEKLNEKFEQFRKKFEDGPKYVSEMDTDYKKDEDDLFVEEKHQENENQSSNCFSGLRKKVKSLNLIFDSFGQKFQKFTTKNSKLTGLAAEINFLNEEIEILINKQRELDQNIEKIIMVIEQQRNERNMYEAKLVAIKTKNELKQPKVEFDSLNEKESEEEFEMISHL